MAMFEIVLDTETTGLDAAGEDRIVEIGCVELENNVPTGRTFHQYINPERDIPEEAFKVHGLSAAFLSSKPIFSEIAQKFLDFIDDRALVIHNAEFDLSHLNNELSIAGLEKISNKNRTMDLRVLESSYGRKIQSFEIHTRPKFTDLLHASIIYYVVSLLWVFCYFLYGLVRV
mgnify:CR=1 FL=1